MSLLSFSGGRRAAATLAAVVVAFSLCAGSARAAIVFALTDENDLVAFDHASPTDLLIGGAVTGLGADDLLGIDFRPSNGELYGVSNQGRIYQIDPFSRAATLISTVDTTLQGSRFGIDFDPVSDKLRIVSDLDQNLSVDVATGVATVNGNLNFAPTSYNPSVTAAAYGTSASSYALFDLDVRGGGDGLVVQNPTTGQLAPVGGLGSDFSAVNGFDIYNNGSVDVGLAALQLTTEGVSRLYQVNLSTGLASLVTNSFESTIGGGDLIDGLTIAPADFNIPEPGSLAAAVGMLALCLRRKR